MIVRVSNDGKYIAKSYKAYVVGIPVEGFGDDEDQAVQDLNTKIKILVDKINSIDFEKVIRE
jgi:hypothetical protein